MPTTIKGQLILPSRLSGCWKIPIKEEEWVSSGTEELKGNWLGTILSPICWQLIEGFFPAVKEWLSRKKFSGRHSEILLQTELIPTVLLIKESG